ncbi:4-hydroxy-3-methylbut-2-enyl diphosphate reductase [Hominifimenecus sp. rT4P-3]|uniref:4-hydroxy-3-methylbut-2-enyl diphosphate reductase n=1 Tax=Hominifimenecus sp. rT4P-3 TaxID=3242979 RepID=UPI003DA40824
MKVVLAKTAGFCFGVKRAVEQVYEQVRQGTLPIYTYGPIIHNEEVVADLESRGVQVIHDEEELAKITEGTIIIRSHGVGREVQEKMNAQGLTVVDATCPFVKKIHKAVDRASAAGDTVVIVGDRNHPEVIGICGWSRTKPYVVSTLEEIETIPPAEKMTVVSQTTFNYKKFQELVEKMEEKGYHSSVVNTICNATQERQIEARTIAKGVDAMIVIGGRHSSNTQKLYDICKAECNQTFYVQTLVDLKTQCFPNVRSVGITAGASTPNNIIEEVHTYVRSKL